VAASRLRASRIKEQPFSLHCKASLGANSRYTTTSRYFHSDEILRMKLGLAIASLEEGRWKSRSRTSVQYFHNSTSCFNHALRKLHETFLYVETQFS
jgi:hypothetical protein